MKKIFILIAIFYISIINAVTLDKLEKMLVQNHPLSQKSDILKEISDIEKSKAIKELFPQFSLNANGTWKSETISLPIDNPMITLPKQDNDMEQITFEMNQIIYDAGIHRAQKNAIVQKYQADIQSVNVSLRNLKEILMKLYYAVLIQKEKIKISNLRLNTFEEKEKSAQKAKKFGVLLPKDVWIIHKEVLSIKQAIDEENSKLEYLIDKISTLTSEKISKDEEFVIPDISNEKKLRAEISLFESKKELIKLNSKITSKKKFPKMFFYAKLGYGKPGLNTFDNSWNDFQIYGINFKWEIWNWGKYSSEQKIFNKKIELINADEKSFKLSLEMQREESQKKIKQIESQLRMDEQIIALNKKIYESVEKQFKNGTETSSNLIFYTNSYYASKIQKDVRKIQLNFEKYNLNNNIGVIK